MVNPNLQTKGRLLKILHSKFQLASTESSTVDFFNSACGKFGDFFRATVIKTKITSRFILRLHPSLYSHCTYYMYVNSQPLNQPQSYFCFNYSCAKKIGKLSTRQINNFKNKFIQYESWRNCLLCNSVTTQLSTRSTIFLNTKEQFPSGKRNLIVK